MSLPRDTLDRITELALAEVAIEEIDGIPMAARELHDARPKEKAPGTLDLHSLGGLVGYLKSNRDALSPADIVVHVEGPRSVAVVSGLRGPFNQRFTYARASVKDVVAGLFGQFLGVEEFNVRMMSLFTDAGDRAAIVGIAGKVSADEGIKLEDDGFTQKVTTTGGVTTYGNQSVKNPVTLAPYRTFREVEQPNGLFILRFRGGSQHPVSCGLFEADGGAWELVAIASIVEHLKFELGESYEVIG